MCRWPPPVSYTHLDVYKRQTLKGGVSTGFRAPDLRQTVAGWGQVSRGGNMYGNPNLTPEKSVTEEIGLLYDDGEGFNAGLTLFNNDFKDKITRVACPLSQCTEGPNPVSYTHLSSFPPSSAPTSVWCASWRGRWPAAPTRSASIPSTCNARPVSYTHLDVYKRQTMGF